MEDALKEATNKGMVVINLLVVLGDAVKEEEVKEGMEAEEHEHEHEEKEYDHEEEAEYDEHVWLSLKNAAVLTGAIRDALVELDAENADVYTANASAYIEKLNALDARYRRRKRLRKIHADENGSRLTAADVRQSPDG